VSATNWPCNAAPGIHHGSRHRELDPSLPRRALCLPRRFLSSVAALPAVRVGLPSDDPGCLCAHNPKVIRQAEARSLGH
jgi:hypothetical protein